MKEILNSFKEGKKREEKEIKEGTDKLIPKNIREKVKKLYLSQEKNLKKTKDIDSLIWMVLMI